MRPDHITDSHAGLPSPEGYSRDPEGARDWLQDIHDRATWEDFELEDNAPRLTLLQRWAIRALRLRPHIQAERDFEFYRGVRYVANTVRHAFLIHGD